MRKFKARQLVEDCNDRRGMRLARFAGRNQTIDPKRGTTGPGSLCQWVGSPNQLGWSRGRSRLNVDLLIRCGATRLSPEIRISRSLYCSKSSKVTQDKPLFPRGPEPNGLLASSMRECTSSGIHAGILSATRPPGESRLGCARSRIENARLAVIRYFRNLRSKPNPPIRGAGLVILVLANHL